MFERLKAKLTGANNFYGDLKEHQIPLYQRYFDRVTAAVDVHNNTRWSQGRDYDRAQLSADDEVMARIIAEEAAAAGLSPAYLQLIVNQYFFADTVERELDREQWVTRVLNRKSVDYFPDPWAVRKVLEAAS